MAPTLAALLVGVAGATDPPSRDVDGLLHGNMQRFVFMGDVVDFGTYPWFGTLFIEKEGGFGTYICGSVLANSKYVVTAAHCVENAEFITVSFNDVYNPEHRWYPHPNRYALYSHPHPLYDTETLAYDIAILELNLPVEDINTPRLALDESEWDLDVSPGDMLTSIGHGLTEEGSLDWELRRVDLPKVSRADCIGSGYNQWHASQVHDDLCVGLTSGCPAPTCPDVCNGDSGGPLFDASSHVVYGLVSRGEAPCGLANRPGIFTNLGLYKSFVEYYAFSDSNSTFVPPNGDAADGPMFRGGAPPGQRIWVALIGVLLVNVLMM